MCRYIQIIKYMLDHDGQRKERREPPNNIINIKEPRRYCIDSYYYKLGIKLY